MCEYTRKNIKKILKNTIFQFYFFKKIYKNSLKNTTLFFYMFGIFSNFLLIITSY